MDNKIIFIFKILILTFSAFVASSEYFILKHFKTSFIKIFLCDLLSPYSFIKFLHKVKKLYWNLYQF